LLVVVVAAAEVEAVEVVEEEVAVVASKTFQIRLLNTSITCLMFLEYVDTMRQV
jgi:hypothetical protein